MSRTKHHRGYQHRHCGTDLWSPRGGMNGKSRTTFNKRLTLRIERAQKRLLLTNKPDPRKDEIFYEEDTFWCTEE